MGGEVILETVSFLAVSLKLVDHYQSIFLGPSLTRIC